MSAGREEAVFKQLIENLIQDFRRRSNARAPAAYAGAPEDSVLEHTARRHFLDKLLTGLGWDLANFEHDVAEEARVRDDTTVFMDYVGVHATSRSPVLIFEAKAWEKPIVSASAAALATGEGQTAATHAELISLALAHCKSNEDKSLCPVSQQWREWLLKLIQYTSAVRNQSGHEVKRVAISSGQWIIVFDDPANAFLDQGAIRTDAIFVFRIEDYVAESECIYSLLAKNRIINSPPAFIRPEQITAHLSARAAKKLFRGLWVHSSATGSPFDVHPQILIYPAIVIQRADEEFVTIVDKGLGHDPIPDDRTAIAAHIEATQERSDRLLNAVQNLLPGLPAPATLAEFPGFDQSPARGTGAVRVYSPDDAQRDFLRSYALSGGQFILATGQNPHFLVTSPRIAGCRAHDWVACRDLNQHVGDTPITARSVEPASFFISTELHHCAHRVLHARRADRCKIRAFETYFCCQACTFHPVCWPGVTDLPCGIGAFATAPTALQGFVETN